MKALFIFLASVMLIVFGVTGHATAILITNGDFETGDLTGWTASNSDWISVQTLFGNNFAYFDVTAEPGMARLSQSFYVDPTWSGIDIEFDVRFTTAALPELDVFREFVLFETGGSYLPATDFSFATTEGIPDTGIWYHATTTIPFDELSFIIDEDDPNAKIIFSLTEFLRDESGAFLDNVSVARSPVPEPASLLLLGSGLAGLVGYGRKKFSKK